MPQSLLSTREVAILAATRGHWGSRRHRNSGDFSDHRHNLAKNSGAARFLGIRTSWDTFLVLLLWKLWLEFWFSLWHILVCFIADQWHLISAAPLAMHPSPPNIPGEYFHNWLLLPQPKPGRRGLEFCFRLGCLCFPPDQCLRSSSHLCLQFQDCLQT